MKKKLNYTKEQFLKDVEKEVRALKRNATEEELSNLDALILNPQSQRSCIYGQLTGSCHSLRASQLIFNCCKRFVEFPDGVDVFHADKGFSKIKGLINGSKIKGVKDADQFYDTRSWDIKYFSSIETYIMFPNAKNKNLIAFLRGERKDLVL